MMDNAVQIDGNWTNFPFCLKEVPSGTNVTCQPSISVPPEKTSVASTPNTTGWVCPVCGAGVAPSVTRCPCVDTKTTPYSPFTPYVPIQPQFPYFPYPGPGPIIWY